VVEFLIGSITHLANVENWIFRLLVRFRFNMIFVLVNWGHNNSCPITYVLIAVPSRRDSKTPTCYYQEIRTVYYNSIHSCTHRLTVPITRAHCTYKSVILGLYRTVGVHLGLNSTTSICCGFVGQQVIQQAVRQLDMLRCCGFLADLRFSMGLFYNLSLIRCTACSTCCIWNRSTTNRSKWNVGLTGWCDEPDSGAVCSDDEAQLATLRVAVTLPW